MVFLLWQAWHRLCRLFLSVKSCSSPSCGVTWSTSVARTRLPRFAHSRHHGSRSSWVARSLFHSGFRYIACLAAAAQLFVFASRRCFSQYFPATSFVQPGCLHGCSGLLGIQSPPKEKDAITNAEISSASSNGVQCAQWNIQNLFLILVFFSQIVNQCFVVVYTIYSGFKSNTVILFFSDSVHNLYCTDTFFHNILRTYNFRIYL